MLGAGSRGEPLDQATLDAEAHEAVAHEVSEQLNARVGVIDTKTNYVEHPRLIADHLHQAVAATGGDPTRVPAGAHCGFVTSAGSNYVEPGILWMKLRAMRGGADLASRELF